MTREQNGSRARAGYQNLNLQQRNLARRLDKRKYLVVRSRIHVLLSNGFFYQPSACLDSGASRGKAITLHELAITSSASGPFLKILHQPFLLDLPVEEHESHGCMPSCLRPLARVLRSSRPQSYSSRIRIAKDRGRIGCGRTPLLDMRNRSGSNSKVDGSQRTMATTLPDKKYKAHFRR
jgi:hypothetical protein